MQGNEYNVGTTFFGLGQVQGFQPSLGLSSIVSHSWEALPYDLRVGMDWPDPEDKLQADFLSLYVRDFGGLDRILNVVNVCFCSEA